jgi:hypothetical protein
MAYDITNFTDYVGRQNEFLTSTLFSGGDTGKFARFMTNVKGKESVPKIDGEATIQKGTCKTASGTTTVTEYFIEVTQWEYYEGFCEDDLQKKFPNTVLAPGSSNADAPSGWQEKTVDVKVASIQKQLELTYWQGDTGGTYSLFDGFIKLIDADGNAVDGNPTAITAVTGITVSNVIGIVDGIVAAADVDVKEADDFAVLCGNDVFDLYIQAVKNANNYHYSADNDGSTYMIGGSGKILRKVRGLNGTDRLFASRGSNFVVGMDVMDEETIMKIWYSEDDDKLYFRTKAKSGVVPVNIEEIVEFTLA